MSARCLKLRVLLLLSLVPLALRAATLLLGGHGVAPAASSSPRHSSWAWHGASRATAAAATAASGVVSAAGPVHDRPYRHDARRRRRSEGASDSDSVRRLRQADGGDWFEDDKRLAPTGSNPLHNLR